MLADMGTNLWAFGSPRQGPQTTSYTVEKGRQGYGMSLRAIRVYLGDTDKYCVQHLVRVCRFKALQILSSCRL